MRCVSAASCSKPMAPSPAIERIASSIGLCADDIPLNAPSPFENASVHACGLMPGTAPPAGGCAACANCANWRAPASIRSTTSFCEPACGANMRDHCSRPSCHGSFAPACAAPCPPCAACSDHDFQYCWLSASQAFDQGAPLDVSA